MVQNRAKGAVVALLTPDGVYQQMPHRQRGDSSSQRASDEVQAKIDPGHDTTGCDDVVIVNQDALGSEPDARESRAKLVLKQPVGGCRAAIEQAGMTEPESSGANRGDRDAIGMTSSQRVMKIGVCFAPGACEIGRQDKDVVARQIEIGGVSGGNDDPAHRSVGARPSGMAACDIQQIGEAVERGLLRTFIVDQADADCFWQI